MLWLYGKTIQIFAIRYLSTAPMFSCSFYLIVLGAIFQCLDSVLTIAACLSHKTPFVSPFSKRREADTKKRSFTVGHSDHLTMLNAYNVSILML